MGLWPGLQVGMGVGFFVGDKVWAAGVVVIIDGVAIGVIGGGAGVGVGGQNGC